MPRAILGRMARANWLLLLPALPMVLGCATKRPDLVLTNRFQHLDDAASSVGVDLGTYYSTFVGEVGEGLELATVTDLAARVEDEALCRARVREDGKVLEVWGLKEGDAVVGLRYARPGSLRPEHRRVRFHFFALPANPALAVGAPIAKSAHGLDLAAHEARQPARCWPAGRGRQEAARKLGVEGRTDVELFFCAPKKELAPGDFRHAQDCVGLCPDREQVTVCAELEDGRVKALTALERTEAGFVLLHREGAENGPCTPAR